MNLIALPSSAWVPTTISTVPSARPFLTCVSSSFGGGDEARGLRDLQRKAPEALGESLEVLARQQRGRHHDGHLLAVRAPPRRRRAAPPRSCRSRHRRTPSRSIGRPDARSSQHRIDGALLVLGLVIGKRGAELVVDACAARCSRGASVQLPRGRDLDELARHLADAASSAWPCAPASRRRPAGRAATSVSSEP